MITLIASFSHERQGSVEEEFRNGFRHGFPAAASGVDESASQGRRPAAPMPAWLAVRDLMKTDKSG